jgi:glycerate 2-kinase
MTQREDAIEIFLTGVESVKPDTLINRYITLDQKILKIQEIWFDLTAIEDIYVVGFGKASAAMANAIESILGSRITDGHIVTKYEHSMPLKFIGLTEAGHPVPDENGLKGTEKILTLAQRAGEHDLFLCLISGGGSALLADVPDGCTLDDLKAVNSILLKTGANINEMNCIRKHLSKVKGGLLAKAAYPARVVSIILSDVIGDPLDVIASGPTAPDSTTFDEAISIIRRYKIEDDIPVQVYKVLLEGHEKKRQETLKYSDETLVNTSNLIIGNNTLALKTAKEMAETLGYETQIITNKLDGDVTDVASYIVNTAIKFNKEKNINKRVCLLFGGEPTIKLAGNGLGGRNQHLALLTARFLKDYTGITVLSGGTDGTDGPTDAAGAVVDSFTYQNALNHNITMEEYIRKCDSYNFFKKVGGLLITGPTQTNVMDLIIVLIE